MLLNVDNRSKSQLRQAIDRFLAFLETENRSRITVINYRRSLAMTERFLKVASPCQVNKESVRRLKLELHQHRTKNGEQLSVRTKSLTVLVRHTRSMMILRLG